MITFLRCPVWRNPCKAVCRRFRACDCGPEFRFQVHILCCRDGGSLFRSTKDLSLAYRRGSFDRRSIVTSSRTGRKPQVAFVLLAQRAFAAIEAAALRCSSLILAARRLPPILPPLRPIWAMSWDTTDLVSFGSWGFSVGALPVSLLTAMIPAWISSSGSLRERFRIHQLGTVRRLASSLRKFKVAHYPAFTYSLRVLNLRL